MTLPIRVLVVDDAVVVRRLIAQTLEQDAGIKVVGTASDGDIALERLARQAVDVVTLDIDMPEMNGLLALREIRRRWPRLPVIIVSGMLEPESVELEALSLGPNDVLQKLPHEGNMLNAMQWVTGRLAPRLKAIVREWERRAAPPVEAARPAVSGGWPMPRPTGRTARPRVLVIGSSTGGPDALERVLSQLPADFPLPIVVVQHMPVGFTRLLADRLTAKTALSAAEAAPGVPLQPGQIWVAPGDYHVTLRQAAGVVTLQTNREAPENSCRPAVDVLFRSAAEVYGPEVLGVVLTGMGYDGLRGSEAVVRAGGQVLAQDEATSVVWGMPGAVARAGLASGVLPLAAMADAIVTRTRGGLVLAAQP